MTSQDIEISLLNDSDIDEVLNFSNTIYNTNRTREKFVWEFYDAPAGKAIYVVAKDINNQKIVGTQCAIPIELITDAGTTILSAKSEDTLVDPEYRGLQILENMYQFLFAKCREQGIKYIWGFTPAKKPFLKLGFSIPFDHSQSLMVLNMRSSYNYLSALNAKNNFRSLSKIAALCTLSRITGLKRMLISDKDIEKEFSFLANSKTSNDYSKGILKKNAKGFWINLDLPFMLWRLVKNPNHKEILNVSISKDSMVVGNIIFNHHKYGVWYLIDDSYSIDLSVDQKTAILKKAINLLLQKEKGNIKLIRTWDFSHNEYGTNEISIRKQVGFVHIDRGISFVWKSLDDNNMLNVSDFNLSRIASQGVI